VTLLLIYLFIAIGISFICSILEAVLLSMTPYFVAGLQQENPRAYPVVKGIKDRIDHSIAAILTLNTIAHTLGAAGVGVEAVRVFGEEAMFPVSVILTFLILYVSEIIPKTLGALYWQKLIVPSAYIIRFLTLLLWPIVRLTLFTTNLFKPSKGPQTSRKDILTVAEMGEKSGSIGEKEGDILENLLQLRELDAIDIMTPRSVVSALPIESSIEEALNAKQSAPFSRFPVYEGNIDNIVGFVLAHTLKDEQLLGNGARPIKEILLPLYSVPEQMPLNKLLELFLRRREFMFRVRDRYGQTEGIVTLEDVVESLLGVEIIDERDQIDDLQAYAKAQAKSSVERHID